MFKGLKEERSYGKNIWRLESEKPITIHKYQAWNGTKNVPVMLSKTGKGQVRCTYSFKDFKAPSKKSRFRWTLDKQHGKWLETTAVLPYSLITVSVIDLEKVSFSAMQNLMTVC